MKSENVIVTQITANAQELNKREKHSHVTVKILFELQITGSDVTS